MRGDHFVVAGVEAASGSHTASTSIFACCDAVQVVDHVNVVARSVLRLSSSKLSGLGIWLVETILSHPELSAVRFVLGTDDAHGLYERFGLRPLDAARWMERGRSHVPADRNV